MGERVIPINLVTSWSYSRYSDYKRCPLMFKYKHIDKIKEPKNAAMERGLHIHELAEQYIKGLITKIPEELKSFETDFKNLRKQFKKIINGMVVEDNWAFTKTWTSTAWNNWASCWVRIKLDCAYHENDDTLIIKDWKTGKFYAAQNEEYLEQIELYALAALLLFKHIKYVKPFLTYLDIGKSHPEKSEALIFTREDIPKLKKLWEKRTTPMFSDTVFAPRPNDKCKWCFFRNNNKAAGGGQCKF